jgi:hypothetical protein
MQAGDHTEAISLTKIQEQKSERKIDRRILILMSLGVLTFISLLLVVIFLESRNSSTLNETLPGTDYQVETNNLETTANDVDTSPNIHDLLNAFLAETPLNVRFTGDAQAYRQYSLEGEPQPYDNTNVTSHDGKFSAYLARTTASSFVDKVYIKNNETDEVTEISTPSINYIESWSPNDLYLAIGGRTAPQGATYFISVQDSIVTQLGYSTGSGMWTENNDYVHVKFYREYPSELGRPWDAGWPGGISIFNSLTRSSKDILVPTVTDEYGSGIFINVKRDSFSYFKTVTTDNFKTNRGESQVWTSGYNGENSVQVTSFEDGAQAAKSLYMAAYPQAKDTDQLNPVSYGMFDRGWMLFNIYHISSQDDGTYTTIAVYLPSLEAYYIGTSTKYIAW